MLNIIDILKIIIAYVISNILMMVYLIQYVNYVIIIAKNVQIKQTTAHYALKLVFIIGKRMEAGNVLAYKDILTII